MSLPSDYIVDRRRLARKLSFWRIAAFVALIVAILVAGWRLTGGVGALRPHIARLPIEGLITGDAATIKLTEDICKSKAAAVLVEINSPGGTTTGAERLYDALRRLSACKPTVAVVGTLAASGGYIAALGADAIFAQGNSLVGSIGVLFEFPNFAGLLDKIGVAVETVKSSPLKASPNGFEPTSPAARAALAALVADSYDWFKALVKERRRLSDPDLATVSDGRVFTGRQGIPLHLVDRLGDEREAVSWLEQEKGVAKNLPIETWRRPDSLGRFGIFSLSARVAEGLGFSGLAHLIESSRTFAEIGYLDGLLSIWHADSSE
jgi:protease-4